MKHGFSFLVLVLVSWGCSDKEPQLKPGITFPDNILSMYCVDTMQVKDPVLISKDDCQYILPRNILYKCTNVDSLILRKDVFAFITMVHFDFLLRDEYSKRNPINKNLYDEQLVFVFDAYQYFNNLILIDSLSGFNVYDFGIKPKAFLLTFIPDFIPVMRFYPEDSTYSDDEIEDVSYSKQYWLTLSPIYTKVDKEKIMAKGMQLYKLSQQSKLIKDSLKRKYFGL